MHQKKLKKGVTVLMCTYNGANNLPATLRHLASQIVDKDLSWEVLLVDNASTDNSRELAQQEWARLTMSIPLIIAEEKQPGKDKAIDLGLSIARYSYVIICDDDNWLNSDYIHTAFHIMESNPQIGLLGGYGIPVASEALPAWFERVGGYYAVGPQNHRSGELKSHPAIIRFLWGAGAVVNMNAYRLLRKSGFKRIVTLEHFPSFARSEDVEFSLAMQLTGYSIWYDSRLIYQHHITRDRLTWAFLLKLTKPASMISPYLKLYHNLINTGNQKAPFVNQRGPELFRIIIAFYKSTTFEDFKKLTLTLFGFSREGDLSCQIRLSRFYTFYSSLLAYRDNKKNYRRVAALKNRILEERNAAGIKFWHDLSLVQPDDRCNLQEIPIDNLRLTYS